MKLKKLHLIGALAFAFISASLLACTEKKETTTSTNAELYPYTIEHPDNWEVGSTANTMLALKALKAWEEGKMDESLKYFGDSVTVQFDGLDKKMLNDSLKVFLAGLWNNSFKIKMKDFESVISKDKSTEWVTLWYRESWEANGVKDSSDVINNMKFKDGKIILLDNYTRKIH